MRNVLTATFATIFLTFVFGQFAFAGDCKGVRFKYLNYTGAKVKMKKMEVVGNDGAWTENINNHVIKAGSQYTTRKQRLNKLDSGKRGNFTVIYNRRNSAGVKPRWVEVRQIFPDKLCNDDITMLFELTGS